MNTSRDLCSHVFVCYICTVIPQIASNVVNKRSPIQAIFKILTVYEQNTSPCSTTFGQRCCGVSDIRSSSETLHFQASPSFQNVLPNAPISMCYLAKIPTKLKLLACFVAFGNLKCECDTCILLHSDFKAWGKNLVPRGFLHNPKQACSIYWYLSGKVCYKFYWILACLVYMGIIFIICHQCFSVNPEILTCLVMGRVKHSTYRLNIRLLQLFQNWPTFSSCMAAGLTKAGCLASFCWTCMLEYQQAPMAESADWSVGGVESTPPL